MATSGSYNGNSVTYGCYIFINWQLASQNTAGNYSTINWQAYFHFQGADSQLDAGVVNSNVGNLWTNGGRVYNYAGNFTTRNLGLASGSFNVGHDSAGNGVVQLGVGITSGFGRSEGTSGVWGLPQIARQANMTNLSQDIDDLADPWVEFSNAGGFPVNVWLEVAGVRYFQANSVGSRYTWTLSSTDRDTLRALTPSSNTMGIRYVVETNIGGTYYSDYRDRTYIVVSANPTFTTFTYRDSNSTTSTITGNDQYLIQGYSTLEMAILATNKALAIKQASMVKYNSAISSISTDTTYTTSNIAQALGTLGVPSNTDLVVSAIDSRGNTTAVTKNVNVLPYTVPVVVATARRQNNFETATDFHIQGTISRLTISSTDKNAVNTSTGVAYRYKKTTDVSWGSWTNKTSATTTGNVAVTDFSVNLDRNYAWNVEVRIIDKLTTGTLALVVPVGTPIFRVSTYDNLVYNNEQPLMPSHIGMIIQSVGLTTASAVQAIYGGTWVAWGAGRVLVGMGTNGTTNYTTVEATGGAETHTHGAGTFQANVENFTTGGTFYMDGKFSNSNVYNANARNRVSGSAATEANSETQDQGIVVGGTSATGDSRQPYQTAYMWKRTA